MEDIDLRIAAVDKAQSAVEVGVIEPDKLEGGIEAADHFRRQVRGPRVWQLRSWQNCWPRQCYQMSQQLELKM